MRRRSSRGFIAAVSAAAAIAAAGLGVNACSTSSGGGADGGTDAAPTSCASSALEIVFAPMYSAYESSHKYQIPAVVNGISSAAVQWGASDPTMLTIEQDTSTGGILITAEKAGTVNIIATAGSLCGSSTLTITSTTANDWMIGNARYNDGVAIHFAPPGMGGGDGGMTMGDGGVACTNCHGPTATMGAFNDVAHTPEQTGGFSDQDLINIVVHGVVPDGGYFDPSIISYDRWQQFHQWTDIQSDEQQGIVTYLRSLTPTSQGGSADFGGMLMRDGGFGPPPVGDGGGGPTPPPQDSGAGGG